MGYREFQKKSGTYIAGLIITICFLFCSVTSTHSQVSRSVYFLEQVPSSAILNPAFHPTCNFFIDMPFLSSFYLGFESPFTFDELTKKWETGDSLNIDRGTVLGVLDKKNYFSFEFNSELFRGGFRIKNHFIQFNISKAFSTKFSFEKDLATLFLYGNANEQFLGKEFFLSGTGLNMTLYHEFALGYSVKLADKISIGARLKYLNGSFNIWSEKMDFMLYTNENSNFPLTASSDILIHTSSTISSFNNMIRQISGYKWFDLSQNHGYGFDFGLDYEVTDKVSVSASIIDIGWITWKENVKNFTSVNPGAEYTFEGFDVSSFISNGSFSDTVDILDTITDHFGLETTHEAYTSHLNPKLYLAGMWHFTRNNELGLMIRTDFTEEKIKPSLTLNYTHNFGKVLAINTNYSYINKNYYNIGLGLVIRLGPVQLYAMNDMVVAIFEPQKARNYNFHFGLSFLFGKPEKRTDMPTYSPSE